MQLKIALEIETDGEYLCTMYSAPERLVSNIHEIEGHNGWSITRTYICNKYGMEVGKE